MEDNRNILQNNTQPKTTKKKVFSIVLFVMCILVAVGCFFFSRYCLEVFPIEGMSMEPTIYEKDFTLIFKTKNVDYEDIIIAKAGYADIYLVKRVIGLPGDKIEIIEENGAFYVYRNGKKLQEDYINEPMRAGSYYEMEFVVPEGEIFYLGDNRNHSTDSHDGYTIEIEDISGIVFLKYRGTKIKFL